MINSQLFLCFGCEFNFNFFIFTNKTLDQLVLLHFYQLSKQRITPTTILHLQLFYTSLLKKSLMLMHAIKINLCA